MPNEVLTPERVAELKRLCEKATPGPWRTGREDMQSYDGATGEPFASVYCDDNRAEFHLGERLPYVIATVPGEDCKENARLIAAARIALPFLLQEREELIAKVESLEREREKVWPIVSAAVGPKAAEEIFRGMADMAEKLESAESALRAQQSWGKGEYWTGLALPPSPAETREE